MDVLLLIFSSGWASGLNGYAVVLILGLAGRFADAPGVPSVLERTDVLVAAALLTLLDLVADKIPYLDSVWDAIHTFIRPVIGGAVGALLAGQAGDLNQAVGAGLGALTALTSHSIKSGVRAAVNTSPEPVTNMAVSTAEDLAVTGVVVLSTQHPWAAAAIAFSLLVAGGVAVAVLASRIRRFVRNRRQRRDGGTAVIEGRLIEGPPIEGPPIGDPSVEDRTVDGSGSAGGVQPASQEGQLGG
jgi:hypothetical protein